MKAAKLMPEMGNYRAMVRRCTYPSDNKYHMYGAIGIKVCKWWMASFSNFMFDMGNKPPKTSIDRIDGTLGYFPGNCRWADATTQNRNRSMSVILTHRGQTKHVIEWANELGVPSHRIRNRLSAGWSVEAALTTPLIPDGDPRRMVKAWEGSRARGRRNRGL